MRTRLFALLAPLPVVGWIQVRPAQSPSSTKASGTKSFKNKSFDPPTVNTDAAIEAAIANVENSTQIRARAAAERGQRAQAPNADR